MPEEQEVTLEQATEALRQLNTGEEDMEAIDGHMDDAGGSDAAPAQSEQPEAASEPAPDDATASAQAADDTGTEAEADESAPQPEQEQIGADDMKALEQRFTERIEAMKRRSEQNQTILRNRLLQKASASDSALKILQQALTEDGVRPEDVKQVIAQLQGTMNPASASYAPPPQPMASPYAQAQAQPDALLEDHNMVLNNFLDEKGLTEPEAYEFGNWIRTESERVMSPAELNVAQHSLDGFLRLAHGKWESQVSEKEKAARTSDAVDAVKSVQRTQRAAARAASSQPTAPRTQPASPAKDVDLSNLSGGDISDLVRQSVEQYKY